MDFPTQGKLEQGYLANILIGIHSSSFTGTLGLSRGNVKKVLSFSKGKPVSARSNILKESIGGMLVSQSRLTQDQLEEIVKIVNASDGLKIGQVLISKKILTNFELDQLLKNQINKRISECLSWDSGEYKIVEGKVADIERVSLDENIPEIIYKSARAIDNLEYLQKSVPVSSIPVKSNGSSVNLNDLKVSGKDLSLFRLVDGTKTLDTIIKESKADKKFVLGFFYALSRLGIINFSASPGKSVQTDNRVDLKDSGASQKNISEKALKLFERLQSKFKDMEGKNYFDYFGVERSATANEIKMEYFKIAKDFHPDKLPKDFSAEMRKHGEKFFSLITDAYNTLTDEQKKKEYLDKISLEAQGISQPASQILESEIEFQKGQILLKKADFDGACEHFKRAIALYSDEAEYYVHLGLSLFRKGAKVKDSGLISNAKREIEKGISKNPKSDRAYLYLGHIAKFEQNIDKAKTFYQKALEINSNCLEASSELRLINSRQDKGVKSKGSKGFLKK